MKNLKRIPRLVLNALRLRSVRSLLGVMFFLAAYAVSGRELWLVLAAIAGGIALVGEVARRRQAQALINMLPDLDTALELQRQKMEQAAAQRQKEDPAEDSSTPIHLSDGLRPLHKPIDFEFFLGKSVALPEANVAIEPGDYTARILLTHSPPAKDADWPESTVRCDFQMQLKDGRRLEANSKLYLPLLADLERPPFSAVAVPWKDAPTSWQKAVTKSCLACDIQICDDGRSRFSLALGDRKHVIMTKYLSYTIDLAFADEGKDLIVRVHGLLAEKWSGDPFSESDQDAEFLDYEAVEPFATRIPVEILVPFCVPNVHVDASAEFVNDEVPVRYRVLD